MVYKKYTDNNMIIVLFIGLFIGGFMMSTLELGGDCIRDDILDDVCQEMFNNDYVYDEGFTGQSLVFRCIHNNTTPDITIYKEP